VRRRSFGHRFRRRDGRCGLRTREAICLCEAAGYDTLIVETVGVGQSEASVAHMTDLFAVMVAPGGGDALQGVKRGVLELADLLIVNKCDGALETEAQRTRAEHADALSLRRSRDDDPDWVPLVMAVSAREGTGVMDIWERLCALEAWRTDRGHREARRRKQLSQWVCEAIEEELVRRSGGPGMEAFPKDIGEGLESGALDPRSAAREMLRAFGK